MKRTSLLIPLCTALAVLVLAAAPAAAQAPKTATVTTTELKGTVVKAEGNNLVVKMSTGEIRTFRVPEDRKALIDGKELPVHELQPGTMLTATITTTTPPVTIRTKPVRGAKVWYVGGSTLILTLPNGENKMYSVSEGQKFIVNGKPATVFDLRQGMDVSVENIVEEPTVEIATNSTIVGQAPPAAAQSPKPAQAPPTAPLKSQPATPAAGETTNPLLWVGLILALIVIAVVVYRRTQKKK